jgi:hypothetical protein
MVEEVLRDLPLIDWYRRRLYTRQLLHTAHTAQITSSTHDVQDHRYRPRTLSRLETLRSLSYVLLAMKNLFESGGSCPDNLTPST